MKNANRKMRKQWQQIIGAMMLSIVIGLGAMVMMQAAGCSPDEEAAFSQAHPSTRVAAATQVTENAQDKFDPIAQKGQVIAGDVQGVAEQGASIGIPGAGVIAGVASIIGGIFGIYNERRRGTVPLTTALTQVVQSVEAAIPSKTDAQKQAMASVQDAATKAIVTQIKGT